MQPCSVSDETTSSGAQTLDNLQLMMRQIIENTSSIFFVTSGSYPAGESAQEAHATLANHIEICLKVLTVYQLIANDESLAIDKDTW